MMFHRRAVPKYLFCRTPLFLVTLWAFALSSACGDDAEPKQETKFALLVTQSGPGKINSTPEAIDCGDVCGAQLLSGSEFTLIATAEPGAKFIEWGGDCIHAAKRTRCTLTMDQEKSVTASFRRRGTILSVIKKGEGQIVSDPEGIDCGELCDEDYPPGTTVSLTAIPADGYNFSAWTGCTSTPKSTPTIDVEIKDLALECIADFVVTSRQLEVTRPSGGSVTSEPAGIACARSGGTCRHAYDYGTRVKLSAQPKPGHRFIDWALDCTGTSTICGIDMTDNMKVAANFEAAQVQMNVAVHGGQGRVLSQPAGIDCDESANNSCVADFDYGTPVTLEVSAPTGWEFVSWGGDASCGISPSCAITMTSSKSVIANFSEFRWDLAVVKVGQGTVVSSVAGINCGSDCSEPYEPGVEVTLTAQASSHFHFIGWDDNGCTGLGPCTFTMNRDRTVRAVFEPIQIDLALSVQGNGRVGSQPTGIDCPTDCSETYNSGTTVTLTAMPDPVHVLSSWTGAACTTGNTCQFDILQTTTVTASFELYCAQTSVQPSACNGLCVDLDDDLQNCGACNIVCPSGGGCIAGQCECPGVNAAVCNGACSDLDSDNDNCGACATACPSGASCVAGECSCSGTGAQCAWLCTASGCDDAISVKAGTAHSCALRQSGEVVCFGDNRFGQLGDGTTNPRLTPVAVVGLSDAVEISLGAHHSCARRQSGEVVCWGHNDYGQVGNFSALTQSSPGAVPNLSDAVEISLGDGHSCARRASGAVVCWGWNLDGQLGNGTNDNAAIPEAVMNLSTAEEISVGSSHSCARLSSGVVKCWGANNYGQLGRGNNLPSSQPVHAIALSGVLEISVGGDHSCVRKAAGEVLCWGNNSRGQIGDGTHFNRYSRMNTVAVDGAVELSLGRSHSCARRHDGRVKCWGANDNGQLGSEVLTASAAFAFNLSDATQIDAGGHHNCALRATGELRCWGANASGQIGDNSTAGEVYPRRYTYVEGLSNVAEVSVGVEHACARLNNGLVYCWGRNLYGALGRGNYSPSTVPVQVVDLTDAVEIEAGDFHTCARRGDGTVYCWGWNYFGQVGDGTNYARPRPSAVLGVTDAVEITSGAEFVCARRQDNSLVCWGRNYDGQLGNGTNTDSRNAIAVTGLSDVSNIVAGFSHICAAQQSGRVYCWGNNHQGQLGDGTSLDRSLPVAVVSLNDAVGVTGGSGHSCAVRSTGGVACWGNNSTGQLGNRNVINQWTPGAVASVNAAVQIDSGISHTCARTSNGGLECWGWNAYGQLGDGTTTSRTRRVLVSELDEVIQFSAGGTASCAVRQNGRAVCWGGNSAGQLGDGSTTTRSTAVVTITVPGRVTPRAVTPPSICDGTRVDLQSNPEHCGACRRECPVGGTCASASCSCPGAGQSCAWACSGNTCNDPVQVASGGNFSCTRRISGEVYCWGANGFGQLGDNSSLNRNTPVAVSGLLDAVKVSVGDAHACAVQQSGTVLCWGLNFAGQLGDGTFSTRFQPTQVTGLSNAIDIQLGDQHSCALLQSGSVSCWGSNDWGQLGDGTLMPRGMPTTVPGITNATQIAVGSEHTCVLFQNGDVSCWGQNDRGQLGDSTTNFRAVPGWVLNEVDGISAGGRHSCARLTTGELRCFGANDQGQLGNASNIDQYSPVPVWSLNDAVQISVGRSTSCARRAGGQLLCWGENGLFQLGNGLGPQSFNVPVAVSGLSSVLDVSVGSDHGCAIRSDSQIACFGDNVFGSLGDGTNQSAIAPVLVQIP